MVENYAVNAAGHMTIDLGCYAETAADTGSLDRIVRTMNGEHERLHTSSRTLIATTSSVEANP